MASFVMDVAHLLGETQVIEKWFIEAENRQKAKYWFHRHYKQFGYQPGWATNKHTIDIGGPQVVELEWLTEIEDPARAEILADELVEFPKV
jgi:hypothetical protein